MKISLAPYKVTSNREYIYADFVEVVALVQNKNLVTQTDIIDRFDDYQINIGKDGENLTEAIDSADAEELDGKERWSQHIFSLLEFRANQFGNDYAFDVSRRGIRLKENLSDRNKVYLMLLLCSNLDHFWSWQNDLTRDFELLSLEAAKSLLSEHAIFKAFGNGSEYSGSAKEKIKALADDMRVKTNDTEIDLILGNKDRGLDVVGWLPFSDKIPNLISLFGQCACGKEWYAKQNETRRFDSSYFIFKGARPLHALFVPYFLSRDDGMFFQSDEINEGTLLLDRGRLFGLLSNSQWFSSLDSKTIVDLCVEFKEDLGE